MPTFKITTLGCKVNQSESDTISGRMETGGWTRAKDDETADVCIINTCAVTQKASQQSRQAIRQLIRSQPNARVLVTGCYSQIEPDMIRNIDGVHTIVEQSEKEAIPNSLDPADCKSPTPSRDAPPPSGLSENRRTRAFLKIQDGCDAFCTYCIVPHARGRSRSIPVRDVLGDINRLAGDGYREVVLTGIHLGCYGRDLNPGRLRLTDLLERIIEQTSIERIRLSSIEPLEFDSDLIRLMASSERICHHAHIPLQSGDNGILNRMGRPYAQENFKNLVLDIQQKIPDAAIGLDILIGFPGETDSAFQNTYRLVKALPAGYLHVFPFSPRKGTPAYTYADKVPDPVIRSRCKAMRTLGNEKKRLFYERFLGKTMTVLVEKKWDNESRLLKGITSNYIPVVFDGSKHLRNHMVDVSLESVQNDRWVFGTLKQPRS